MQSIDEAQLESDPQYRYEYLADFIGFGPDDVRLIQAGAPHIGPRIGELVEKTYEKLLSYDATARHFLPQQHGFEGETPTDLAELTASHPQVQFRKDHLNRYFVALIGCRRRSENVAPGGEWPSAEKRSAQMITCGSFFKLSEVPKSFELACRRRQGCSPTWISGLRFAVAF